jgi:hypothetical protein
MREKAALVNGNVTNRFRVCDARGPIVRDGNRVKSCFQIRKSLKSLATLSGLVLYGEPFKSSEYPRERVNGEAEGKRPRLFSLISGAFRDLGVWRNQTESALISAKNRISETGSNNFVYNSQILCFTEKSYLTASRPALGSTSW